MMLSLDTLLTVLATAVTVAGGMGVVGRWVLRAVIRDDVQPLREAMLSLTQQVGSLTNTLEKAEVHQKEEREDLHDAVTAIRAMLANHDTRLALLEQVPVARAKPRTRSST